MKLTRAIHTDTQAFYGPVSELVPDIKIPGEDSSVARVLLFVDAGAGEAHGFIFTNEQARELAASIQAGTPPDAPALEVVRTLPGSLLGSPRGA